MRAAATPVILTQNRRINLHFHKRFRLGSECEFSAQNTTTPIYDQVISSGTNNKLDLAGTFNVILGNGVDPSNPFWNTPIRVGRCFQALRPQTEPTAAPSTPSLSQLTLSLTLLDFLFTQPCHKRNRHADLYGCRLSRSPPACSQDFCSGPGCCAASAAESARRLILFTPR